MAVTPAERLDAALTTLQWSGRTLANLLRRDKTQVHRWLQGAYQPPDEVLAWVEELAAFHEAHPVPRVRRVE